MYTQQTAQLLLFTVMTAMSNVHAYTTCQNCAFYGLTGEGYCCIHSFDNYDMISMIYSDNYDDYSNSMDMYIAMNMMSCSDDRCVSPSHLPSPLPSPLPPPSPPFNASAFCGEGTAWYGQVCMCDSALAPANNAIGAPNTGLMLEDPNAKIWFGSGPANCSLGLDATKAALVASCPIVASSSAAGSGRRMAQMEAKKIEALTADNEALAKKIEALTADNEALAKKIEALKA